MIEDNPFGLVEGYHYLRVQHDGEDHILFTQEGLEKISRVCPPEMRAYALELCEQARRESAYYSATLPLPGPTV